MTSFDKAWSLVKEDSMSNAKAAIIQCLKKEGGAAGLDKCCKASGLSMDKCKALINTMSNIKIHDNGDVILMDGL
tara:strand:- start:1015 stop:1239 length:225 start_codon:yes stop_codon:yes gene_type:complete